MPVEPLHVVAYDVSCPRRWRRVFRLLKRRGARGQLSVFLVRGAGPAIRQLRTELETILDPREDALLIAAIDERAGLGLATYGRTGSPPVAQVTVI